MNRRGQPKAKPRWATTPSRGVSARTRRIYAAARRLGIDLADHQRLILRVAGEDQRSGLPRYRTVIATLPRQQGKTTALRPYVLEVMESNPGCLVAYTAQDRQGAAARVLEYGAAFAGAGVPVQVRRGTGAERVEMIDTGSVLIPMAPNASAAHGYSIDYLIADELHGITPEAMGAIRPAMAARPKSQMLGISTMGTVESTVLNGYVEAGRADEASDLAYFEWSIPEEADPYDESEWWRAMPMLGVTVDPDFIRSEASTQTRPDFVRAYANRVTSVAEPAIPTEWIERASAIRDPGDWMVLSVDANAGHHAGISIVAAWPPGTAEYHYEVAWHQRGADYAAIEPVLADLVRRRRIRAVAVDAKQGNAAVDVIVRRICDQAGVPVHAISSSDLIAGCGYLYTGMGDGSVTMQPSPPLVDAIAGATRRVFENGWLFARTRSSADVSPLMAAAAALYVVRLAENRPKLAIY